MRGPDVTAPHPPRHPGRHRLHPALATVLLVTLAACAHSTPVPAAVSSPVPSASGSAGPSAPAPTTASTASPLPGMPPVTDPHDVYAAAGPGKLAAAVRTAQPLVYVPHTKSRDVWVIDPRTFAVVARYPLGGGELQHVVPSWDLRTLYASDDTDDRLPPFDPVVLSQKGSLFLTRPSLGHYTADRAALLHRADAVLGAVARGELKLRIERTYALADVAQAHRDLEARLTSGKLLIER